MAGVIVGRALQGAGAVGAVILAMVGRPHVGREPHQGDGGGRHHDRRVVPHRAGRGPDRGGFIGVPGIFWLMVVLGCVGHRDHAVRRADAAAARSVHRDAETVPAFFGSVLRNPALLRLDLGIFVLHAILTASFLVVPGLLRSTLNVAPDDDWMIYLPVLLVSVVVMGGAIGLGDRRGKSERVFIGAIMALGVEQRACSSAAAATRSC